MYKKTLGKIKIFNRWNMKYPPDDWTILGFAIWWQGPEYYQYRICLFGIELRIGVNRKWHKPY